MAKKTNAVLNQIIAIEKGIKSRTHSAMSELYKIVQKSDAFLGLTRIYDPINDDGEKLPDEIKRVQITYGDILRGSERHLTELMEVTARKDWTNCEARADIKVTVDGEVRTLLADVPVTYLLFLEKTLTDLHTMMVNLPTLDSSENWKLDTESGIYRSETSRRQVTKKLQRPLVMFPATVEHPAQTQLITEDVPVGYWTQSKSSGAMPRTEHANLVERLERLIISVKEAREAANMQDEAATPNVGGLFSYITGTL